MPCIGFVLMLVVVSGQCGCPCYLPPPLPEEKILHFKSGKKLDVLDGKNNIVRTRGRGKTWCKFSWSVRSGFHVWIKTLEKRNYLLVDCDSKHAECSINRKVLCRPCRDNLLILLNETLNNVVP